MKRKTLKCDVCLSEHIVEVVSFGDIKMCMMCKGCRTFLAKVIGEMVNIGSRCLDGL